MLNQLRSGVAARTAARAFCIAALAIMAGSLACTERGGPTAINTPGGPGRLAVRPRFVVLGADQSLPINKVRITIRSKSTNALLGELGQTVDASAAEWDLSVSVNLPDAASVDAIVLIELVNVGPGGVETIEWSGTSELRISPAETGQVANVEIYRGPPGNLTITAVQITEPIAIMAEGGSQQLNATVTGGSGAQVFWSSLNPAIVTASVDGVITAVLPGTARIVAVAGPRSDTVSVTVRQRLSAVQITPPTNVRLESVNAEHVFQARALDARGAEVAGAVIEWSSTNTNVAEHMGGGRFRARSNGTTTITASAESDPTIRATTTLTVVQRVTNASLTPNPIQLNSLGSTQPVVAVARDAMSNQATDARFVWTSTNSAVATVDANGLVRAVSVGTATIRATTPAVPSAPTPADTVSVTAAVTVTQAIATINIAPAAHTLTAFGETVQFVATVRDGSGTLMPNVALAWSTSNGNFASVNGSGLAMALGNGPVEIRATAGGVTGTAQLNVLQTVTRVTVAPVRDTLRSVGAQRQFVATLTDRNGSQVVNRPITWTSSNADVADVNATGLATARTAGGTTITATSGTVSGNAALVVQLPVQTVGSIVVTPNPRTLTAIGDTAHFVATARDASGAVMPNVVFTWSTADTNLATVSTTGIATAAGSGTVDIRATAGSVTGSAQLNVVQTVTRVVVTPALDTLRSTGATRQFTAALTDRNGFAVVNRPVTWTSSNSDVAGVNATGLATAHTTGGTTITATSGNVAGNATLVVQLPVQTVASIVVTTNPRTLTAIGDTAHFVATARDANGAVMPNVVFTWSSADVNIATVNGNIATAAGAGTVDIRASAGGATGTAQLNVVQTVTRVVVTPTPDTLRSVGATRQFTAALTDRNGFQVLNRPVTWGSSSTDVADINPTGLATARTAGSTTITATSGTASGNATLVVQLSAQGVGTVVVTPNPRSLTAIADTAHFVATVRDASGALMPNVPVTWSSADVNIATVNGNIATAAGAGTVDIRATAGGVTGTAQLNIVQTVTRVVVAPALDTLRSVGATRQFTAALTDRNGFAIANRPVTWTSSNTEVADVNATGLATARTNGGTTITATSGTVSGNATLVVQLPVQTVGSIVVTPNPRTLTAIGDTAHFVATARDASGAAMPNVAFTWSSAADNLATVSTTGIATAAGAGTVDIRATAGGVTGTAQLNIVQTVTRVVVTPTPDTLRSVGATRQFAAALTDRNGFAIANRPITWASSNTDVADVNATGLATARTAGSTTITATSGTVSGTATLVVQLPVQTVASIEVALNPRTLTALGDTAHFVATARDASGAVMPNVTFTWSSGNVAAATINPSGVATAVGAGTGIDIRATAGGVTGTAQLNVVQTVTRVVVTPVQDTLRSVGATRQFTATLSDRNGFPIANRPVTWASSNTEAADVSATGLATARAGGTTSISATSGDISGNATLIVMIAPPVVAAVTVEPPQPTVSAGETVQLVATARDAQNVVVPGVVFTWTSADDTKAIVSATGLVTGKLAGAVQITATGGGRSGSSAVTVVAGPAASITAFSGSGQVAPAGQPLAQPIRARIADALGNPVGGITVDFVVTNTNGAGRVNPTSAITDVAGLATTTWTVGAAGAQTLEARAGNLTPAQFTANVAGALGVTVTWVGGSPAAPTSWDNDANWSPARRPTGTDTVFIPAVAQNQPVLNLNGVSIGGLIVESGATLTTNFNLTVTGSADAGNTISGTGTVTLSGTGTARGTFPNLNITGVISATGPLVSTGHLQVLQSGRLTINGQTVNAARFSTGNGILSMTNPADILDVAGTITFSSADQGGALSAGLIRARKSFFVFCGNGRDFVSTGTGVVMLGTGTDTLRMDCPGLNNQRFQNLEIAKTDGSVVLTGQGAFATGAVTISTPTIVGGAAGMTIFGDLTTVANSHVNTTGTVTIGGAAGTTLVNGTFRPGTTVMGGTNQVLKSSLGYANLTVQGAGASFNGPASIAGDLNVTGNAANLALGGLTTVGADAFVGNGTANLTLGGHKLMVAGNLSTSGGTFTLTNPADTIDVAGRTSFSSADQNNKLTAGLIRAQRSFFVFCGHGRDFVSTGTGVVMLGAGTDTLRMDCPGANNQRFQNLEIAKTGGNVVLTGQGAYATGNVNLATPVSIGGAAALNVVGNLSTVAGSTVNTTGVVTIGGAAGTTLVNGTFTPGTTVMTGANQVLKATLGYVNLTIQGAGASFNGASNVGGDLNVTGSGAGLSLGGLTTVVADAFVGNGAANLTLGGQKLTVGGNLSTSGGTFTMTNPADLIDVAGRTSFSSADQANKLTAGAIRVQKSFFVFCGHGRDFVSTGTRVIMLGAGTDTLRMDCPSANNQRFQNVDILKTGGNVVLTGQGAYATGTVTVGTPTTIGGAANLFVGGDLITAQGSTVNTTGTVTIGGGGGTTLIEGTFSPGTTVTNGTSQFLESTLGYRNLTVQGPGTNWNGVGTINGTLTVSGNGANLALGGDITVNGDVQLGSGSSNLTLNGKNLLVSGDLATSGGTLTLANEGDVVDVAGRITFSGADHTNKLTNGVIRARKSFFVFCGHGRDFVSTGTRVVMQGAGVDTLRMDCPGPSNQRMQHLEIEKTGGNLVLTSQPAYLTGNFTVSRPVAVSGVGLTIVGDLFTSEGSTVSPARITLAGAAGTTMVNGAFSPTDLTLNGTSPQTLKSALGYQNVLTQNIVNITAPTSVAGHMFVGGNGELRPSGFEFTVAGNFTTQSGGLLRMTNPSDALTVLGATSFGGANQNGSLSAGVLRAAGSFTVNCNQGQDFVSTGTLLVLNGTAPQSVAMHCSNAGQQRLQNLQINSTNGVNLANPVYATGNVALNSPTTLTGNALTVVGDLSSIVGSTISIATVSLCGPLGTTQINGTFNPTTLVLCSPTAPQTLKPGLSYQNVTASGIVLFSANTTIAGNLLVNAGGDLRPSGYNVNVNGNFTTQSGGLLRMASANDTLIVAGITAFGGANQNGLLGAGVLRAAGNFVANCNQGQDFVSTGMLLVLNGTAPQSLAMHCSNAAQQRIRNLQISNTVSVNLLNSTYVEGDVAVSSAASLNGENVQGNFGLAATTLVTGNAMTVIGNLSSIPGSNITVTTLSICGSLGTTQINGEFSPTTLVLCSPTAPQTLKSGLAYQNVTASGIALFSANTTIGGNLLVNAGGDLRPSGRTVTVNGSFTTQSGGLLRMSTPSDSLNVVGITTFGGANQSGSLTSGVLRAGGNFVVNCNTGQDFASTGTTLVLNGAAPQNLSMHCSSPTQQRLSDLQIAKTGGTVTLTNNSLVNGGFSVLSPTTVSGNTTVTVAGDVSTAVGSAVTLNTVIVGGAAGTTLVNGSWSPQRTVMQRAGSQTIKPGLAYKTLQIASSASLAGATTVDTLLLSKPLASLSELSVNGQTLTINMALNSSGTGGDLLMFDAKDMVIVNGNATFTNNIEDGHLAEGTFRIKGNLTATCNSQQDFVSTGTRVVFDGTTPQTLNLACSDSLRHRMKDVVVAAGANLTIGANNIRVTGDFTNFGALTVPANRTLDILGYLTLKTGSTTTNNGTIKTVRAAYTQEAGAGTPAPNPVTAR